MINDVIQKIKIGELSLDDPFFQSLRADYEGFDEWFQSKAEKEAYIFRENGTLGGFLFLKDEDEEDSTITPIFEKRRRLKIGTFKINSHGTVLGQRFISIILRKMIEDNYSTTYVTLFEKQQGLINLFKKYGFQLWGNKANGELVYVKTIESVKDIYKDYPRINDVNSRKFLLAIKPEFHTQMFPNSRLDTERNHIVEDLSFTNTIEKIYITGMNGISDMKIGDLLVIYRTKDYSALSAEYSSVATSICTVVDVRHMRGFETVEDYLRYCGKGSIFSEQQLKDFFRTNRFPYIVKMLYNFPLKKRIVRQKLINEIGFDRNQYFGFFEISNNQFYKILEMGEVDEGFIID